MMVTRHGHSDRRGRTPTYLTWCSMKARCDNPNETGYQNYGGRGITYDPRWAVFEAFMDDMGERPQGRTLDRIDVYANYSKENCRWSTPGEQVRNRRVQSNSSTGVTGVTWRRKEKNYSATGFIDKKKVHLYYGPSFELACKARAEFDAMAASGVEG